MKLFEVTSDDVALTSDEWYTPSWLFDAAGLVFDLDVCAPVEPAFRTCPAHRYLTVVDDGLTEPWSGLVWMNPPFSKPAPWVDRFVAHAGGGLVLVPPGNGKWRGPLLAVADAMALINVNHNGRAGDYSRLNTGFGRPDGSRAAYPTALILAARGKQACTGLARVAMADPYAGGAWFVRG